MMASAIAQYLHSLGLVTYNASGIGGTCFIDVVPASPDQVVVITDYPGPPGDVLHGYDYPNVQIRVRSTRDPRPGKAKLAAIYNALHNLHSTTLPGGTWLVSCWARQSGPAPLGPDQNGRHEYTMNFELHIRNVTAHRV